MSTRQTLLTEMLSLFRAPERYAVPSHHRDLTTGLPFVLEPSQEQPCQLAFHEHNLRFHALTLPVRKRLRYRRSYIGIHSRALPKDVLVYDDLLSQEAPDQQGLQCISKLLSTKQTDELFWYWIRQPNLLQHLLPLPLRATVRRMPNDGMQIHIFSLLQSRPLVQIGPEHIRPVVGESRPAKNQQYPQHLDLEWQYDEQGKNWICQGICRAKIEWFRLGADFFGNNLNRLISIALREKIYHDELFCPCLQLNSRQVPKVLGQPLATALNLGLSTIPKLITLGVSYQLDKRQAYLFGIAQTPVDYFRFTTVEMDRLKAAFAARSSASASNPTASAAANIIDSTYAMDDGLPVRGTLDHQRHTSHTRTEEHERVAATREVTENPTALVDLLTGLGKRALVNSALDEPIYQQLFEFFYHLQQHENRLQRVPLYTAIQHNFVRLSLCSQSDWQLIKTMLTNDTDFAKPLMLSGNVQPGHIAQIMKHPWYGKYLIYLLCTLIYANQQLPQMMQDRKALNGLIRMFTGDSVQTLQPLLDWLEAVTKHTNLRELLRKQLNNHRQQKLLHYYQVASTQPATATTLGATDFAYQIEMVSGGTAHVNLSQGASINHETKAQTGSEDNGSWVLTLALNPAINSPSPTKAKSTANIKVLIKQQQAHIIFVVADQTLMKSITPLLPQLQRQLKRLGYASSVSTSTQIATKRQLSGYQPTSSYTSHGFKI